MRNLRGQVALYSPAARGKLSSPQRGGQTINLSVHPSTETGQLHTGAGVAIRSTFDRLKTSLEGSETAVYLGEVTYIDSSKDLIPEGNAFTPAMCKRKSFEHESELRALVMDLEISEGGHVDFEASVWEVGVEVEADLKTLVEKVHVSPTAPVWFADLVAAVTARCGFEWDITQSLLLEDPIF